MKTKMTLIADEGKILTNGTHYGRIVYLALDDDGSAWYEITEEEYEHILNTEEGKFFDIR